MHALNSSGRITERSSMTWPSFFIGYCWGIGNRWLCCFPRTVRVHFGGPTCTISDWRLGTLRVGGIE